MYFDVIGWQHRYYLCLKYSDLKLEMKTMLAN